MTPVRFDVVIVGGGHAGAQAAVALRQEKFGGTIAIVGAEHDLPYERPPLSKEYLGGEKTFERILIRPAAFWNKRAIDFLLGERVVSVDAGFDDAVLRGDPATRSFSVVYLRDGRVIAVDAVNAIKDYVQGRALVVNGVRAAPADLADTARPLKELG